MYMKKYFVAALFLLTAATASMTAQEAMPPIPIDKDVRIGKLDNGLTYPLLLIPVVHDYKSSYAFVSCCSGVDTGYSYSHEHAYGIACGKA